jgi:hypothetical protein
LEVKDKIVKETERKSKQDQKGIEKERMRQFADCMATRLLKAKEEQKEEEKFLFIYFT